MAKTITIIHSKTDPNSVHKFQNFGEDIWRAYRDDKRCKVDLDEIDRASDRFSITCRNSMVGHAQASINKLLKAHYLDMDCKVELS